MKTPKIQFRKDYEMFSFLQGNRPLNHNKIQKIVSDIEAGFNLLPYCPVIVFEKDFKLFIVDGQHRFEAAKLTESPVFYVVSEELNLFQIATMNSKQEKWSEKDFLNCYIELGISDYSQLKDLIQKYHFSLAVVAELLMNGVYTKGKEIIDVFRSGNFKVNHLETAEASLSLITDIFGRYKFFNDRNLMLAVQQLKSKGLCDFDYLKEKIKKAPMVLDKQSSSKDYIFNIERVYNHKNTIRKAIF